MTSGASFIIPVYNEAAILEDNCLSLFNSIKELRIPFEIIIGDNGSTDSTRAIGHRLAKENSEVQFFSLLQKGIVGRIFGEAVKMSLYEKIVSLDIDLTIDLSFIPESLGLLDEFDMVIGSKKVGEELRSWVRRLGSDTYIWVAKNLLGLEYSDYSIGAKAYRKSAILPYLGRMDEKTGYVLTLIHHLQKDNNQIVQIPVSCHDQRGSKFSLIQEGLYRFIHLFRLRMYR